MKHSLLLYKRYRLFFFVLFFTNQLQKRTVSSFTNNSRHGCYRMKTSAFMNKKGLQTTNVYVNSPSNCDDPDISFEVTKESYLLEVLSRRSFISASMLLTNFAINENGSPSRIANAQEIEQSVGSKVNDENFASFGESLNNMDFGVGGVSSDASGASSNQSSNQPKSEYDQQRDKSEQDRNTEEKGLSDVLKEKQKRRAVDPRTHG
mmetsp:Transcript_32565/g.37929  ORF Transcript_32565/g.37929 Transcript_32565/m.37929 type:complete len:206 (-) Transcript_32565:119-736(-)